MTRANETLTGRDEMTTYETKLGTAKITSGRMLIQGKWGVMATIGGKKAFLTFDGKPDLEAAFPAPVRSGVRARAQKSAEAKLYDDMDKANSHN